MATPPPSPKRKPKTLIGWREWVEMPELGLPAVQAKIDTGAKTSALHAYAIEEFEKDGMPYVRFKVHPLQKKKSYAQQCEAKIVDKRNVRSSNGEREKRIVIWTPLKIAGKEIEAEITLTARHKMEFRMLLGREAMRKARLAVDPAKSYLHGKIEDAQALYK